MTRCTTMESKMASYKSAWQEISDIFSTARGAINCVKSRLHRDAALTEVKRQIDVNCFR